MVASFYRACNIGDSKSQRTRSRDKITMQKLQSHRMRLEDKVREQCHDTRSWDEVMGRGQGRG